ncbi:hypothetical protein Hanom_Chr06g00521971 [Helianthus anomalus]
MKPKSVCGVNLYDLHVSMFKFCFIFSASYNQLHLSASLTSIIMMIKISYKL